jgi:hypothetical protein
LELGETYAQTSGIERRYGKRADTALVAAGPAGEPCAASPRGFRHGSIHDLDEGGVGGHLKRSWHRRGHAPPISRSGDIIPSQ